MKLTKFNKTKDFKKLDQTTKIALVVSPYYSDISDNLVSGAKKVISDLNIASDIIQVEGALEIPGAIS